MNKKEKIESFAIDKFQFLQDQLGLKEPIIERDIFNTTISYLSREIGYEIELDWRDLDVFVLITKLDKGKQPEGYYMFEGQRVRKHLEKVLQDNFDLQKAQILESSRSSKKKIKRNQDTMITSRVRGVIISFHWVAAGALGN